MGNHDLDIGSVVTVPTIIWTGGLITEKRGIRKESRSASTGNAIHEANEKQAVTKG
jgi:hypothetical protein